jgi:hypothetical protein
MGIRFHWLIGSLLLASQLPASQFLFSTPSGATNGTTPVAATALFTTSNGQLQITVQNTELDLLSESAALAEMTFQVSSILTSPGMTSSAEFATVKSNGSYSTSGPSSTGWTLTENSYTMTICDACTSHPVHTMIGPPKTRTGRYTDANNTIDGSAANNPFLWESAAYTISSGALTMDVKITNVKFYFGAVAGQGEVNGIGGEELPEPSTTPLVAGGALLLALAAAWRRHTALR